MQKFLDVVVPYSNPMRWKTRAAVHKEFEDAMLATPYVRLTTVECGYGDREHELQDRPGVNRVRVRAKTLVWNKENLINLGISRLPEDWRQVAWVDGDIFFRKRQWAEEAVHALQLNHIIQPWSDAYDLGPNDEHMQGHKSFLHQWRQGHPCHSTKWSFAGGPYDYPHSGYAWCATRQAIDWLGGLLEIGAVGAGDHHMALALIGAARFSMPGNVSAAYRRHVQQWEERARSHICESLHFLWGSVEHHWHGRKSDRRYIDRWSILTGNDFDPDTDLKRNSHGVLELAGNKLAMAHQMDRYFRQRNEDANTIS